MRDGLLVCGTAAGTPRADFPEHDAPPPASKRAGRLGGAAGMIGDARRADPARRFPFSAVIGQPDARLALLLAAIDPAIGGVLLRGDRGSARSALSRGLRAPAPTRGR